MSEERLQKILARAGIASRRKAEELIREGRVTVNGQVAAIGAKADLERDSVKLDERRIQVPVAHRYLLLNKPRGVMSTVSDPAGRRTVIDLVPPAMRRALAPVGRLDFLTEGLLLLTDDGDLAQQVAHPSFGCWKTYEVKVRGRPAEEQLDRLRAGIVLEGRRTAPCRIASLGRPARKMAAAARRAGGAGGAGDAAGRRRPRRAPESDNASWWSVELGEGRTRQIREMFQRIGHPVQKLRRVAIGPVSDPNLPVGSLRELSEREVAALRKAGPPDLSRSRRPAGPRPRRPAPRTEAPRKRGPAPAARPARASAPASGRTGISPVAGRKRSPRSAGDGSAARRGRASPSASRGASRSADRGGPLSASRGASRSANLAGQPSRPRGASRSGDRAGPPSGPRGASSRSGARPGPLSGRRGAAPAGRGGGRPGRSAGPAPRRGRR
jgi:23S rRNA pseudouridine2605 synthase